MISFHYADIIFILQLCGARGHLCWLLLCGHGCMIEICDYSSSPNYQTTQTSFNDQLISNINYFIKKFPHDLVMTKTLNILLGYDLFFILEHILLMILVSINDILWWISDCLMIWRKTKFNSYALYSSFSYLSKMSGLL